MVITLSTIVAGLVLLVLGYRLGTMSGLAVMGGGGLVLSLGLRVLFDLHGTAGHDADRPSEFMDGTTPGGF